MVFSINIDESKTRAVRGPRRRKTGGITFIVDIEERGRPNVRRNLTRGVNIVDDNIDPIPPVTPESISIALQSLILSLNLDAIWGGRELALPSLPMDLTSNLGYKVLVDSDVAVGLPINDIQITVGAELEALPVELTNIIEAQADEASLKPLELTLTNEIRSITTENLEEPLEAIELTLTNGELGYKVIVDSDVEVGLPINDIQIDVSEQFEALPISLSIEDLEAEVAANFDIPSMELTLPAVEIVTTHDEALEPITITLTNEIEVITEAGALGVVELELSNRAALDIVQESDVSASLTVLRLATSQGIATDAVELELTNEFALDGSVNSESVELELSNKAALDIVQESDVSASLTVLNLVTDQGIATDTVELELTVPTINVRTTITIPQDVLEVDDFPVPSISMHDLILSELGVFDTSINIEIPADAQGPDADEATTVTMVA